MNLHEHFLPKDLVEASKEYKCLKDCLKIVTKSIDQGDINKAKDCTIDALKSIHELSKLASDKERVQRERMMSLIPGMPTVVRIEVMRSLENE